MEVARTRILSAVEVEVEVVECVHGYSHRKKTGLAPLTQNPYPRHDEQNWHRNMKNKYNQNREKKIKIWLHQFAGKATEREKNCRTGKSGYF
jgi:hypothetical protein